MFGKILVTNRYVILLGYFIQIQWNPVNTTAAILHPASPRFMYKVVLGLVSKKNIERANARKIRYVSLVSRHSFMESAI